MKTEELKALGLSDEQVRSVFELNGKEIDKQKRRIAELEADLENANEQFRQADETLKKFGDMTPDKYQEELEKYKKAAEDAKSEYESKLTRKDQSEWIDQKLDEYGVASPYARKQLKAECLSEDSGLKWKDNAFFGFDDFMKAAKKNDNGLYLSEEEKRAAAEENAAKEKAPRFTGPMQGDGTGTETKTKVPPKIF